MKLKKLAKAKADKVAAMATKLNVPLKDTRTVEREKTDAKGKVVETVVENLATMELQDGSTITVDVDNPEAEEIITRARDRVEGQIKKGTKVRKKA